jgi:hypothetical protein
MVMVARSAATPQVDEQNITDQSIQHRRRRSRIRRRDKISGCLSFKIALTAARLCSRIQKLALG